MVKKSLVLACFSMAICGGAQAEKEIVTININSKISIDKNVEVCQVGALVKEFSKKIHEELSEFRGVTRVETSFDSDCGSVCKREITLCKECGSEKDDAVATTQVEVKCDGCGKILKSCSSCGKCSSSCSSCSSCCK